MRYFTRNEVQQNYGDALDKHPHSTERVHEQIERSRSQLAVSEEILAQLVPQVSHPQSLAMPTAADCRALAKAFKSKAAEAGIPARTATIMNNISHSLSGLASQLEMLADTTSRQTSHPTKA